MELLTLILVARLYYFCEAFEGELILTFFLQQIVQAHIAASIDRVRRKTLQFAPKSLSRLKNAGYNT